jgi:hypothetical protein
LSPPDPAPVESEFEVGTRPAPSIVFPLTGPHSFRNTFGAPRDGGLRRHAGIDIFARKGVPIVAVADGVIEKISEGVLAGRYVIVRHRGGWRSKYMHLDTDTPGTDDGLALGYAEDIEEGMSVAAGTILGFVGDSGNAETTLPHLHFALHQPDGLPINPYRALAKAPEAEAVYPTPVVHTLNTQLVGHLDPDRVGFNAAIAFGADHVFMGTWGNDEICPGTGVRVIDVSDPSEPVRVTAFAGDDDFPGTATDSVWVGRVITPTFVGEIAAVGLRLCDEDAMGRVGGRFAGFAIYDVSDPANPVLMSAVHSGERTHGVSHIEVLYRAGRLLAAATVPQSHLDHPDALGDLRIYELTDLLNVELLSDWDVRRDGPPLLVEALAAPAGEEALAGRSVTWTGPEQIVVAHSGPAW